MAHKNVVTEKMKEILEFPTFDKSYWQALEKLYIREYRERITMKEYSKTSASQVSTVVLETKGKSLDMQFQAVSACKHGPRPTLHSRPSLLDHKNDHSRQFICQASFCTSVSEPPKS